MIMKEYQKLYVKVILLFISAIVLGRWASGRSDCFFSRFDTALSVRLIGIGVDVGSDNSQLELFASEKAAKKRKLEEAVLNIAKKNKDVKIVQARLLPRGE